MAFDLSEVPVTVFRGIASLIVLYIFTKLLGKKQVSQLTLFDYVIGISIGNFAAEMTINLESNAVNGFVAVAVFGFIAYFVSYLTMKSLWVRNIVTGPPTVLIDKGKLIYDNLAKVHYDINDLQQEARINGYFDLNMINYAFLEDNGKLSIMPKKKYANITVEDMKLNIKEDTLVVNVLIDGEIKIEALKYISKTKSWLIKEIKNNGYKTYKELLLVTVDSKYKLTIYEKTNKSNVENIF